MSREEKSATDRAPLCSVCNHRHWGRDPHVFGKGKALEKPKTKAKVRR